MIKGRETCVKRNLEAQGVYTVADLFNKRNLWALAVILEAASNLEKPVKDVLMFAFSGIMLNCSRMYRYRDNLKGGFQQGTYYLPQEAQLINVWRAFEDKVSDLERALSGIPRAEEWIISTQSSVEMGKILQNSVDYIFTDPPYADKIQYGELNFVWEAWLNFDIEWHDEEIIINEIRGKTEVDWASMMRNAMPDASVFLSLDGGFPCAITIHQRELGHLFKTLWLK